MDINKMRRFVLIGIVLSISVILISHFAISTVQAHNDSRVRDQTNSLAANSTDVNLYTWESEIVPITGDINWPYYQYASNLALDQNNYPHIAYSSNLDNPDYSELIHVAWNGSDWVNTQVDSQDDYSFFGISIDIDSNSNPHISYVAIDNITYKYEQRYAFWNGSTWNTETVSNYYDTEKTVIKIDSQDRPHIAHYGEYGGYKVSSWNGTQWTRIDLEEDNCNDVHWQYFEMDLDDNDNPHFLYTAENYCGPTTVKWMKYSAWNGINWDIEFVRQDSLASGLEVVDGYAYITFDENGLYAGVIGGGVWVWRSVDPNGDGRSASLAVPEFDQVYISYESNNNLMIAYGLALPDQIQLVHSDPGGWDDSLFGGYSSLVIDDQGNAHISYSKNPLRYASGVPNPPVANISANPIEGLAPLNVNFCSTSTGIHEDFVWDFGDSSPNSTSPCWIHEYTDVGSYTLSLSVTGPGGDDTITKQDYINVYDGVSDQITPEAGGEITFSSLPDYTVLIDVPEGAVDETITIEYWSLPDLSNPSNSVFAGLAFNLEAFNGGVHVPSLTFLTPINIKIQYSDDLVSGLAEDELTVQYWNGSSWGDAACGAYDRHPDENWLAVPICHLSQFGLFEGGQEYTIRLPLIVK